MTFANIDAFEWFRIAIGVVLVIGGLASRRSSPWLLVIGTYLVVMWDWDELGLPLEPVVLAQLVAGLPLVGWLGYRAYRQAPPKPKPEEPNPL